MKLLYDYPQSPILLFLYLKKMRYSYLTRDEGPRYGGYVNAMVLALVWKLSGMTIEEVALVG